MRKLLLFMILVISPVIAVGQGNSTGEALLKKLVLASEFEFEQEDGFWVTNYGENDEIVGIVLEVSDELLIVQSWPLEEPVSLSGAKLRSLLSMSYQSNFAKIGLDDDGDIIVLNEALLSELSAKEFEQIILGVGGLSQEILLDF